MTHPDRFNVGDAIMTPWRLPGGTNFLIRITLWGAALLLLVYFVFGRSLITSYIELFQNLIAIEQSGNDDPQAALEMFSGMAALQGAAFVMTIGAWIVMIMVETAMHKNVFQGTDKGMVPLRFGRPELMVLVAQLVIFVCVFAVYMLGFFLLAMIIAALGVAGDAGPVLAAIFGIAGFIGFVALLFILMMRWSPAAALSVRDDRIRIFDGWKITKGIGWPLFGAYAIVFIVGYILILVLMSIGAVGFLSGLDFTALETDGAETFAAFGESFKSPGKMIALVIFLMLYAVVTLLWYFHIWGVANYVTQRSGMTPQTVIS